MNIIVCGADGSGKTTLVNELSQIMGLDVIHAGPPPRDDEHALECCEAQLTTMEHPSEYRIYDRITPISRQCYQFDISDQHRQVLNMFLVLMRTHATLIWCDPPSLIHNVESHDTLEHLRYIDNNMDNIVLNYKDMMAKLCDVVRYDYTIHSVSNLRRRIYESVS